jgi:hypothetical protein
MDLVAVPSPLAAVFRDGNFYFSPFRRRSSFFVEHVAGGQLLGFDDASNLETKSTQ